MHRTLAAIAAIAALPAAARADAPPAAPPAAARPAAAAPDGAARRARSCWMIGYAWSTSTDAATDRFGSGAVKLELPADRPPTFDEVVAELARVAPTLGRDGRAAQLVPVAVSPLTCDGRG